MRTQESNYAKISKMRKITQPWDRSLQFRPLREIPDTGLWNISRFNESATDISSDKSVRTRHQYSFCHFGSSVDILLIMTDESEAIDKLNSAVIRRFQTQCTNHSGHSRGLVVILLECLSTFAPLAPESFRMMEKRRIDYVALIRPTFINHTRIASRNQIDG